mgnify:CR=1 FL=1|tara:strand:- start:1072 stop:2004 length:933 start_codon:yes stop_codon:yes gene_type:complete
MNDLTPINQTKIFGLDKYFNELVQLFNQNKYPNKLLLSGQKGLGKSTLAFHFINYTLTLNQDFNYDLQNFKIDNRSSDFKTVLNKSNTNLTIIDVNDDKKMIDINQIRDLIINLNKSSFNKKPRFVLIDNIERLNINSVNALLKVLEEPNENVFFILIHNNRKISTTLLSRCINFKINLTNKDCMDISNKILNENLENLVNKDLINYFFTPGEIFYLIQFSNQNNYDLTKLDLKSFLKVLIKDGHYKKNNFICNVMYDLMEFYFRRLNSSFSQLINEKYSYFLKRIFDTKIYNLDQESLFMEFNDEILNG